MKIVAAAIKSDRFIKSDIALHSCIWVDIFNSGLMPKTREKDMTKEDWETVWLHWETEEGFILENGDFVNREEAAEIALNNSQTYREYISIPGQLHVPDIF